jgi:hypothetical protein
MNLAGMTAVA